MLFKSVGTSCVAPKLLRELSENLKKYYHHSAQLWCTTYFVRSALVILFECFFFHLDAFRILWKVNEPINFHTER